jgi:hypothetical protein
MKDELPNKIETWLETQGYNLEMYSSRIFRDNGFTVAQSVYYLDPDDTKPREIDLVCYYTKTIEDVSFHLTFVIECKKSNDKPWLVFKSKRNFKKYLKYDDIEGTHNGLELLKQIKLTRLGKRKTTIDFLEFENTQFGHGVTQAFTSGSDTTYAATTTVLKATRYFVEKYKKTEVKLCSLYFPIVILDGRLFDIELQDDSKMGIKEVNESKLLQIRSDLNKTNIIQIVTKDNLNEYCKKLKLHCDKFFKTYSKEIGETAKSNPYSGWGFFL